MAGVDADSASVGVDQFQKPLKFLQVLAGAVALPSGVLDDRDDCAGFRQGLADAFGDYLERILEICAQSTAGVEVEIFQAEFFDALEFGNEGLRGILALFGVWIAQVDKIRVVGEDAFRRRVRPLC